MSQQLLRRERPPCVGSVVLQFQREESPTSDYRNSRPGLFFSELTEATLLLFDHGNGLFGDARRVGQFTLDRPLSFLMVLSSGTHVQYFASSTGIF